jgi:hypothetical protein
VFNVFRCLCKNELSFREGCGEEKCKGELLRDGGEWSKSWKPNEVSRKLRAGSMLVCYTQSSSDGVYDPKCQNSVTIRAFVI